MQSGCVTIQRVHVNHVFNEITQKRSTKQFKLVSIIIEDVTITSEPT